ncbi:hypothetical protein MKW94_028923 [Papaver nudicaule]|uniref:TF-B3 domain-containing protein n=1 Tax=Papaver nudicaule TaxID=74823 RepID=A0AA41VRZ5_PAPNU|nr:hypothetical protein [Papaver nudicaule]
MEKSVDQEGRKHHFFKGFLEEHKTRLGPSGSCWVIKVHKDQDGGIYLEKGWEVFVQENGLQVSDLLLFRYDGSMQFSVKVFNKHGVEREECFTPVRSSPSVERRTRHGRLSEGFQCEDSPLAQQHKRGGSPLEGLTTKKRRFVDRQQRCNADADRVESDEEESDEDSNEDSGEDEVPKKTTTLSSSRKIERASASRSSTPFFRVTVQPSYLKHSFLRIPDAARRAYFTDNLREVKVKASDGRSWKVGTIATKQNMRLSQGVNYLMDKKNGLNLKLGDVCIFEVVKKKSYKLVVQVHVFRC